MLVCFVYNKRNKRLSLVPIQHMLVAGNQNVVDFYFCFRMKNTITIDLLPPAKKKKKNHIIFLRKRCTRV